MVIDKEINVVVKCIVHMHLTAELTAYWFACYTCIFRKVESIYSGIYIYALWQAYVNDVKCMYTSACGDNVDCIDLI